MYKTGLQVSSNAKVLGQLSARRLTEMFHMSCRMIPGMQSAVRFICLSTWSRLAFFMQFVYFCSLGSKEGAQKPWAAGPAKRRRGRRPKRRKRRKQGHWVSPKSPRPAMGGLSCQKEARMRHGPQLSNMFHRCPMMSYDWLISRGPGVMMGSANLAPDMFDVNNQRHVDPTARSQPVQRLSINPF